MTELLPEKELVTRALASSRDRVGSAVQGRRRVASSMPAMQCNPMALGR